MTVSRFALIGLCGVLGSAAQAQQTVPNPAPSAAPALACTGVFAREAAEAGLIKAFGQAQVKRDDIDIGEGATEPGTVLFGDDPKRRVEILWHDDKKRMKPSMIRVRDEARWRVTVAPQVTIGLGSSLASVEAANGKAFPVNGFGWDGGGFVGDLKGGRLAGLPGGCHLSLRFGPDPKAGGRALDKVSGDKQFSSASAELRAVKPVVEEISIGWEK